MTGEMHIWEVEKNPVVKTLEREMNLINSQTEYGLFTDKTEDNMYIIFRYIHLDIDKALDEFVKRYNGAFVLNQEYGYTEIRFKFFKVAPIKYPNADPNWTYHEYISECLLNNRMAELNRFGINSSDMYKYVRLNIENIDPTAVASWCVSQDFKVHIADIMLYMYKNLPENKRKSMLSHDLHSNDVKVIDYMVKKNDSNIIYLIGSAGKPCLNVMVNDRENEFYTQYLLLRGNNAKRIHTFYDKLNILAKYNFRMVYYKNRFDKIYDLDFKSDDGVHDKPVDTVTLTNTSLNWDELLKRLKEIKRRVSTLEEEQKKMEKMIDDLIALAP